MLGPAESAIPELLLISFKRTVLLGQKQSIRQGINLLDQANTERLGCKFKMAIEIKLDIVTHEQIQIPVVVYIEKRNASSKLPWPRTPAISDTSVKVPSPLFASKV